MVKGIRETNAIPEDTKKTLIDATAKIASGYFSNNHVEENQIQNVIEKVYSGLVATMEKSIYVLHLTLIIIWI